MALPNDLLIGLDVGTSSIAAAAFALDGHQLARVAAPAASHEASAGGGIEQDVGETWRAAAAALRQLGQAVPHLARRTAGLAITGSAAGAWLMDDDGDPVMPAWLPQDPRAEQMIARWRQDGRACQIRAITGCAIEAALPSAGLAWLAEHHPEALDRAATAFAAKDCVYFLCTGERATDAEGAAAAFGDWRRGAYDARVLELLGLRGAAHLLPEIVDGRHQGELTPAAAAATGLNAGTPAVLAPPATIAIALALGLGGRDPGVGGSALGRTNLHMRGCPDLATAEVLAHAAAVAIMPLPFSSGWLGLVRQSGAANVDWLIGVAEQLLVDAGLIGLPRAELRAMLERRAGETAPASLRYRPLASGAGGAAFEGLSDDTSFYDLLRAIWAGLASAARDAHAALGLQPTEVRVSDTGAAGPVARAILAECLGVPLRMIASEAPAATGAALVAAVALGHFRELADAFADWVEPRLSAVPAGERETERAGAAGSPVPTSA